MKRVSSVVAWIIFSVGIPTVLILGEITPQVNLIGLKSNLLVGNWESFALYFASALLWSTWIYGLLAFVHDLWRLRHFTFGSKHSFGFRRWTAMCAAAVWSLLLANHATATATAKIANSNDVARDDSELVKPQAEIDSFDNSTSTPLGLSTSTVLVTGMLQYIQSRRKNTLRKSAPHSQPQALSQKSQSTLKELQLASITTNCDDIRSAMNALIENELSPILASWRPNSTPRAVIQRSKFKVVAPSLCCVPLGLLQGEIILLTLSRGEVISINPDEDGRSRSVLAHLTNSIILETLGSDTNVVAFGFSDAELISAKHLSIVDSAENLVGQIQPNGLFRSTIVCSADPIPMRLVNYLRELDCCVVTASIDIDADLALMRTQLGWLVQPTQQVVSLYGISGEERSAVSKLVSEVSLPTTVPVVVEQLTPSTDWKVIVRLLGPVEVMTRDGKPIRFEKSKSVELLAWLTTHRTRQSRSAARTALWEVNVQDASFTNVVSDVRRSLGRVLQLEESQEWLVRTLTDVLPLHESVTTDSELLNASIHRALSLDADSALAELRDALEYVRDLPFSGTNYLWSDSEGITTQLTLSVMTAAVLASQLYLERGDTEGVFWATGRGLKVLPGHEELLALRMRAHALKGDLAAVRAEWSSHQRAMARDVWSGGSTSPKLDDLCRALLQSTRQNAYSVSE